MNLSKQHQNSFKKQEDEKLRAQEEVAEDEEQSLDGRARREEGLGIHNIEVEGTEAVKIVSHNQNGPKPAAQASELQNIMKSSDEKEK